MSPNLSSPPKFQGPAPRTIGEWVDFWRWLMGLWRWSAGRIDAPQAIALGQPGPPAPNADLILGAAQALERPAMPVRPAEQLPAAIAVPTLRAEERPPVGSVAGRARPDDLTGLVQAALSRPPYPVQQAPIIVEDDSPTLAGLPAYPAPGLLYRNSYFERLWYYDGTAVAWHYADASVGAGAQVATSGTAPSGGLWQACDGSTVACALDNATLGNLTASNTAAVAGNNPTIEGGAGAAQQAAAAATYATANTSAPSGSTIVQSGTGSTVASSGHTHTPPALNAPSEAAGGLPLRVSMAWWMRR